MAAPPIVYPEIMLDEGLAHVMTSAEPRLSEAMGSILGAISVEEGVISLSVELIAYVSEGGQRLARAPPDQEMALLADYLGRLSQADGRLMPPVTQVRNVPLEKANGSK